jgi:type IV pilus assembly protein PilA
MTLGGPFLAKLWKRAGYPAERLVSRAMAVRKCWRSKGQGGFQLVELIIIVAIIGLLAAISVPFLVSYLQAAKLKGNAEIVAAWLNQGRQLAIRNNQSVCADIDGAGMHYHLVNCTGTVWVGAGTNSSGYVPFPAGVTMSVAAPATFTYLGAASPAATYTITHAGRTITVTVATTGRITIP